jgi:hypothetical protein
MLASSFEVCNEQQKEKENRKWLAGVLIANKGIQPVDQLLPPTRLAVYGLQHVLAFYAGASLIWYPHLSPLQGEPFILRVPRVETLG